MRQWKEVKYYIVSFVSSNRELNFKQRIKSREMSYLKFYKILYYCIVVLQALSTHTWPPEEEVLCWDLRMQGWLAPAVTGIIWITAVMFKIFRATPSNSYEAMCWWRVNWPPLLSRYAPEYNLCTISFWIQDKKFRVHFVVVLHLYVDNGNKLGK